MELKFIGQGLDPTSNSTAGNLIIDSLVDERFNSFNAFVAFVSIGGINNIIEQLTAFKARDGAIRLYVGVDLNGTSKEALEKLIDLEIETYIVFSPNNIIYHPKIYAFEGDTFSRAIVGSSNLTERGLFQSIESSVCINFNIEDDEIGIEFLADIYEYYNKIINNDHPSCQRLTAEVLEILVNSKIVLPEIVNRAKFNKNNREFGEKDSVSFDALLKKFGKIEPKRPPRGFKKVITKEEIKVKGDNNVGVINELFELAEGSMWIETRKMTGGSRNILDLSKTGKRDGVLRAGSVAFFGVNPDNTEESKILNLHLGGNVYRDNLILFSAINEKSNKSWRLQLKGETATGEKLTTISRTSLGNNGGFVDKLLLFTKISDSDYTLEIIDATDIQKLIENSTDWCKAGKNGTGRAYGII